MGIPYFDIRETRAKQQTNKQSHKINKN